MRKQLGLFFLLIFLLSSCRPIEDPRALSTNSININITDNGCKPFEIVVPRGTLIQVQINNETQENFTWYILLFDFEDEFDSTDTNNQIAALQAPAEKITNGEFIAPETTAKYMTVCSPDSDPQKFNLINLLVVEPYQEQEIEEK